jgi:hypothetical protein
VLRLGVLSWRALLWFVGKGEQLELTLELGLDLDLEPEPEPEPRIGREEVVL